jgi:phosphate transport system ATP-binding protein
MSEQTAIRTQPFIPENGQIAIQAKDLNVYYGEFRAVKNVDIHIQEKAVTAFIGSSGCGKSTVLRSFNRMNDFIRSARVTGSILFQGRDINQEEADPVAIRRQIGMVFQKPNPFPRSIYDNIAWTAKVNGYKGDMDELVETSLRKATIWDEVKSKLHNSGFSLSGGQQQRLCIARTISIEPDIILMDEPTSALDPVSTAKIEELLQELKKEYTIIMVTHNMQQAVRVSDFTAFFNMDTDRAGELAEYNKTHELFTTPQNEATEKYITGRFG